MSAEWYEIFLRRRHRIDKSANCANVPWMAPPTGPSSWLTTRHRAVVVLAGFGRRLLGRPCCFLSCFAPENVDSTRWGWLPLAVALAVNDALHGLGLESNVKWPNDVLVDGAKLAGILTERVDSSQGVAVITGVGLNVDMKGEQLPTLNATSLRLLNASVDRQGLLVELLSKLQYRYVQWSENQWDQLSESYVSASSTIGREVRVEVPAGEPVSGVATGVDDLGRLIVTTRTGRVHLSAGDVTHLRLAE